MTFLLPEHSGFWPQTHRELLCFGILRAGTFSVRFLLPLRAQANTPTLAVVVASTEYCVFQFTAWGCGPGGVAFCGEGAFLIRCLPLQRSASRLLVVQAYVRPPLPGRPFPTPAPSHPPELLQRSDPGAPTWPQSGNQFPFFFQATRISGPTQGKVLRTGCLIFPNWKPGGVVRVGVPTSSSWLSDLCVLAHC